jgi:hypothetical protein
VTSNGPEHNPSGQGQPPGQWGQPPATPARRGVDLSRLRLADYAVAAGTLLYVVFMALPWFSIDGFDLGSGFEVPGVSVNGFDSGTLTFAFVLLLVASAWALLPAVADVSVPFPRSFVTAGLTALAFLLTLIEWLSTFDAGFTFFGLMTFLASAAVLAFAGLRVLPELRGTTTVPSGLAGAAQWANGPAPQFGSTAGHQPAGPPPGQPQPPPPGQPAYGQPDGGATYGQPPAAGGAPAAEPGEQPRGF